MDFIMITDKQNKSKSIKNILYNQRIHPKKGGKQESCALW